VARGKPLDRRRAEVVPGAVEFGTGIAEADDQDVGGRATAILGRPRPSGEDAAQSLSLCAR